MCAERKVIADYVVRLNKAGETIEVKPMMNTERSDGDFFVYNLVIYYYSRSKNADDATRAAKEFYKFVAATGIWNWRPNDD